MQRRGAHRVELAVQRAGDLPVFGHQVKIEMAAGFPLDDRQGFRDRHRFLVGAAE